MGRKLDGPTVYPVATFRNTLRLFLRRSLIDPHPSDAVVLSDLEPGLFYFDDKLKFLLIAGAILYFEIAKNCDFYVTVEIGYQCVGDVPAFAYERHLEIMTKMFSEL